MVCGSPKSTEALYKWLPSVLFYFQYTNLSSVFHPTIDQTMFFYRILAAAVTVLGVASMVSATAAPEAKDVQADSETPSTLQSVLDLTNLKPHSLLGAV